MGSCSASGKNNLNGTTINGSSVSGGSCRFETAKTDIRGLSDGKYTLKIYKKFNYINKLKSGKSILLFIITAVGINALFEMVISTFFSTAIGTALFKSKLIKVKEKNETWSQKAFPNGKAFVYHFYVKMFFQNCSKITVVPEADKNHQNTNFTSC